MLSGKTALVTGASRGIGRGIALQLGEAGATVYVTGREPKQSDNKAGEITELPTLQKTAQEINARGGKGIAIYCDHSDSEDIKRLFDKIREETDGSLDILVNNAYSAVNLLMEVGGMKFYELEPEVWDSVNNVGLRNHYFCSVYAARMMVARKRGLIVNVSSAGGLQYLFNVAYGVGKAACDRMAADMAHELRKSNVCAVSIWPGAVRTELVMKNLNDQSKENEEKAKKNPEPSLSNMKVVFEDGETTEYTGKAIAHLAADKDLMRKSGKVLMTADLGDEYGFEDIDGRKPPNWRSVQANLKLKQYNRLASWVPAWVKVPGWMIIAGTSKL